MLGKHKGEKEKGMGFKRRSHMGGRERNEVADLKKRRGDDGYSSFRNPLLPLAF